MMEVSKKKSAVMRPRRMRTANDTFQNTNWTRPLEETPLKKQRKEWKRERERKRERRERERKREKRERERKMWRSRKWKEREIKNKREYFTQRCSRKFVKGCHFSVCTCPHPSPHWKQGTISKKESKRTQQALTLSMRTVSVPFVRKLPEQKRPGLAVSAQRGSVFPCLPASQSPPSCPWSCWSSFWWSQQRHCHRARQGQVAERTEKVKKEREKWKMKKKNRRMKNKTKPRRCGWVSRPVPKVACPGIFWAPRRWATSFFQREESGPAMKKGKFRKEKVKFGEWEKRGFKLSTSGRCIQPARCVLANFLRISQRMPCERHLHSQIKEGPEYFGHHRDLSIKQQVPQDWCKKYWDWIMTKWSQFNLIWFSFLFSFHSFVESWMESQRKANILWS